MATFLLIFDYFLQFRHEVSFQSHQYVMVKTSGRHPRDDPVMSAIKLELPVLLILQDSAQKVARIATFLRSGNGVMHVLHNLFQDNQQGSELKDQNRGNTSSRPAALAASPDGLHARAINAASQWIVICFVGG